MFQSLSQGASVTIFYRNDPPRIETGKVVSINTHMPSYNPNQPMAMFNGQASDYWTHGNTHIHTVQTPPYSVVYGKTFVD